MKAHRAFAALACATLVISGCTKVSERAQLGGGAGAVVGTLRYADIQEVTGLNPLLRAEAIGTDLDLFIYGFFFNFDDKINYIPELATDVPTVRNGGISKDGLTITYHLRKGVRWHDGAPFTSRDVVFTYKAIMNPNNNVITRTGYDRIRSVEPVGDYEVKVHLKGKYGPAISQFFSYGGLFPVLPEHLLKGYPNINRVPFNDHPIGTGPFKFVKWVHGDHIELVANPDYWRGAPKLKHIIYKIIPNDNTILTQLKTREADSWFRAPSNFYPQIKTLQGYRIQLEPALQYSHLDLNMKNPIFQDIRVRRAIHYAIDINEIIHKVTHDVQMPADSVVSPKSPWYEPNVMHYGYDPAKAKALLDAAGWQPGPNGMRQRNGTKLAFNLSAVAGGSTGEQTEALIQAQLKQVGISAAIKNYPANLFFDNYQNGGIVQSGKYDAALYSWVQGPDPDSDSIYSCDQIPPAGQNSLYWCDRALTAAEKGQLSSYDPAIRKSYFAVIQKEIASQSVTIVLYFQRVIHVTLPALKGFKPAPATTSNWNTWEWSME